MGLNLPKGWMQPMESAAREPGKDPEINRTEKFLERYMDYIFIAAVLILAVAVRLMVFDFRTHDYETFLAKWMETLREHGFSSFKEGFSDYTPPYLYVLWLLSPLPLDKLYAVKLGSVLFDFLLAFYAMKIAGLSHPRRAYRYAAFAAALFLPTAILNGAVWGQCDVIFTAFLAGCIYYQMKEKPALSMLFFALAFSFKLQAVFLAPFLVFMLIKSRYRLKDFLLIPGVYLGLSIPVLLAGRPLGEVLTIYFSQYNSYSSLTLSCPNFYHWIYPADDYTFSIAGMLLTMAVLAFLAYAGWHLTRGRSIPGNEAVIQIALISVLVMPYFLPRMHERYFFPADAIALIWALYNPRRAVFAVAVSLISVFSCTVYLFGVEPIEMGKMAILMLGVILLVIRETYKALSQNRCL
ncbi:MAG TPA: hypothetical protein DD727_07805 [Clostridiales bacterium]|nr:hypothetical protein [Clostridiales bacterium]